MELKRMLAIYRRALLEVISIANLWVYLGNDQCCFWGQECDVYLGPLSWWSLVITVCLRQVGIPGNLHPCDYILTGCHDCICYILLRRCFSFLIHCTSLVDFVSYCTSPFSLIYSFLTLCGCHFLGASPLWLWASGCFWRFADFSPQLFVHYSLTSRMFDFFHCTSLIVYDVLLYGANCLYNIRLRHPKQYYSSTSLKLALYITVRRAKIIYSFTSLITGHGWYRVAV